DLTHYVSYRSGWSSLRKRPRLPEPWLPIISTDIRSVPITNRNVGNCPKFFADLTMNRLRIISPIKNVKSGKFDSRRFSEQRWDMFSIMLSVFGDFKS